MTSHAEPPRHSAPLVPEIADDLTTILGSMVFPHAGQYAHHQPEDQLHGAPDSISPPQPPPREHLPATDLQLEARLAATLGKVQRLSKTHRDLTTRLKLEEVVEQSTRLLDSVAPEKGKRKGSLSSRAIRALTRLKKELPTMYRMLLVCLVALLAPLVLGAIPLLPLIGL